MTVTGVGMKIGLPLAYAIYGADGLPAHVPAMALVDATGTPISFSGGGSLGTPSVPSFMADAYTNPAAVTWTSATGVNTANTVATAGYDGLMISITAQAGITGGAIAFEVYDGATWIPVQAGKMNAYGGVTSVPLTANMAQGYQINIAGAQQFRTRLATAITGAGNVMVTHLTSSANMPDPQTVGLDPAQPLPAGNNTLGTVLGPLPAAPVTGQQVLTTAAVALPASVLSNGITVTALSTNTGTVYVGAAGVTAATGYPLSAGQSFSFAVANASGISILGTNATDRVAFAGN